MAKKKKRTAAPSGLNMDKKLNVFTCHWTIPSSGYDDGQQWKYNIATRTSPSGSVTNNWKDYTDIGKSTTSKKITIDTTKYYPDVQNKFLNTIAFKVRGRRKDTKTKNYIYSEARTDTTYIKIPDPPKIDLSVSNTYKLTYTISQPDFFDDISEDAYSKPVQYYAYWATYVESQTCLIYNKDTPSESDWTYTPSERDHPSISRQISSLNLTRDSIYYAQNQSQITTMYKEINDSSNSSTISSSKSAVRWFRARVVGPAGASSWVTKQYPYVASSGCTISSVTLTKNSQGTGYTGSVSFSYSNTTSAPLDYIIIQYAFASPSGSSLSPVSPSPQTATVSGDNTIVLPSTDASGRMMTKNFIINDVEGNDQLVYVRLQSYYQGVAVHNTSWYLCRSSDGTIPGGSGGGSGGGALTKPSSLSVSTAGTNLISVTCTNNSSVDGVKIAVIWVPNNSSNDGTVIGILSPEGTGSVTGTIAIPSVSSGTEYGIGVYAFVGTYTQTSSSPYSTYAVDATLKSATVTTGGTVPVPPTNVTATHLGDGHVKVSWKWTWTYAEYAIVGWSDYQYATTSTNPPQTYTVSNINVKNGYADITVSGLETGKTWYFWVKLVKNNTESLWSDPAEVNLSSEPNVPYFELSRSFITINDTVTASWTYVTTDTTPQKSATVSVGTYDTTTKVFTATGTPIIIDGATQFVDLDPKELGWSTGTDYWISVKVTSESNMTSKDWAEPKKLTVVAPLTCSITSVKESDDGGETYTALVNDELTVLPMEVKVTGAGDTTKRTSIFIERVGNYFLDRPDGGQYGGNSGEIVAAFSHEGEEPFYITADTLNPGTYLDDTARYAIKAEVTDDYGQIATDSYRFSVAWEHQAVMPEATITIDYDYMAAIIDIAENDYAEEGDACDIYRISMDDIRLIYSGAKFGEKYVDPYPTIGDQGGHRIVFRTKNGDTTTAERTLAWVDFDEEDGDIFETTTNIIDFGTDSVELMYNVDFSNSWSKDFQQTRYLGGSIEGDWNAGVERTGSVSASVATRDVETVKGLHRLAMYDGMCHVRAKDGSNYDANVEVSESIPHDPYYDRNTGEFTKLGSYSLSMTRVDNGLQSLVGDGANDYGAMPYREFLNYAKLRIRDEEDEEGSFILPDGKVLLFKNNY